MRISRHGSRRLFTAVACLVWILGFELMPNLHVGMHEAFGHHHHGRGGHDVEQAAHDDHHDHGDADHHHDHHDADHHHDDLDLDHEAPAAACESMDEHGRHSLAHRDIAATPAPWVLASVASAPFTLLERLDQPVAEPRSREPQAVRARGPPALT